MKRQTVIIMLIPDQEPICRGNFKKMCEEFQLPYHTLKKQELPISLEDSAIKSIPESFKKATIYRVPFNPEEN